VRGDVSSQFLSGILIAAPLADAPLIVRVEGPLVSQPYVEMTLAVMRAFGASFERDGFREFRFPGTGGDGGYVGREYAVEPDASSASYFFAAAAITEGSVTVEGIGRQSLQGDLKFIDVLERMGCRVDRGESSTTVHGAPLHGVDVDMTHISDTVPTLAAVACFASGPTRIRGVGHIRHKETDRIAALARELRKTGCDVQEHPDGLTIVPRPPTPAVFDTYNDHRMAMALALLGLKRPGIAVRDPGCTAKTYPSYFSDLAQLSES
jgi:3-phosphoshikimate 1-carboxyvinyltransferase